MLEVAAAPTKQRQWLAFHLVFAALATAVILVPIGDLGPRVLLLVIAYNVAVVWVARATEDEQMWTIWLVLAPMSVLMVLPDWFLSAVLGTIEFPNTGAPYIGTMPLFMAGMWVIALLPLMLIGLWVEAAKGPLLAFTTVAAAGMALFIAAEWLAPALPLWEPLGVVTIAGVAIYVLVPELALCVATYELVRGARERPTALTVGGIIVIPFMYLGMLATSYQFLG